MNMPRKIDLHMHSTVSDGTDTPEEILENYEGFLKGEAYAVQQSKGKRYAKAMRTSGGEVTHR